MASLAEIADLAFIRAELIKTCGCLCAKVELRR
jgi:hypothetical protein